MKPQISEMKEECQTLLNSLLVQVRKDIERLTSAGSILTSQGTVDVDILEDYLYHVNTFYYRTFDQKMMPVYLDKVNQVIAEVYRVGRNGEQMRNDIATNLARCAGFYNLLKQLIQTFDEAEQVIREDLKRIREKRVRINLQIREIIGDVTFEIKSVEQLFNGLEKIGETREWFQSVEDDLQLLQAVWLYKQSWAEEANARFRDELGRWITQTETFIQRLEEAARSTGERETVEDWTFVRSEALMLGKAPGLSSLLAVPIRQRLGDWIEFELEKEAFYKEQGQSEQADAHRARFMAEVKRRLERWVRVLREMLRLSREGVDREILSEIGSLESIAGACAESMARLLREFQRELKALTDKLERYPDMGPFELEKSFDEAFHRYERELRDRWARANLSDMTKLGRRVKYTLEYLELVGVKLSYQRERLEINLEQQERYRHLLEELYGYRQVFSGLKQDLENLMSPSSLKRVWRDLAVEVKRYPLNPGNKLPPECLPIVEKGYVELRPGAEEEHLVVLEEKGDIFWIRVDEIERWEVPHLVLGVRR